MTDKRKILLVDDEATQLLTNGLYFQGAFPEYDIVTALGPLRAFEEVAQHNEAIDGIVSDFKMPGMNGLDFLTSASIYFQGQKNYEDVFRLIISSLAEHRSNTDVNIHVPSKAFEINAAFLLRTRIGKTLADQARDLFDQHYSRTNDGFYIASERDF
jgi:CheY-like chemotaxis protein